ncbi:MAG TPA: hypothetical protein PKG88_01080 [Bacteroidales bacterium]|jgi:hypothetical protein|nr:hypothetical protein [Bacteroidales bacterium]HPS71562.1 hypothetical protein [Bacteroidales bacterium]
MKKLEKILTILLLTLVYGVTINIGVYSGFFLGNQTNTSSEQEEYYATVTQNITCHTSQTENTIPSYKNFPSQSLKICFKEFFALNILFDHLFETKISQTSQLLRTFHLQQHKFEIIYPFHYFW